MATPSKSTTEKSNMKTSATTTKSPTVSTKGSTMKTGWIHNGEYITSIQGGGLKQVIVSGTETFQRLIELLSSAYKPTHDIKGVKLGKSTMELLTEFTTGAKTLGEHIKKTRMVYSKMRVYVVTDDGCCTCSQDYPDFEMSFVRDDVTIHDPSSVLAHLALQRPSMRELQDINPISEGFILTILKKCRQCKVSYIDWVVDNEDNVKVVHSQSNFEGDKILHGPEVIHGMNGGKKFVGVVTSKSDALVRWWKDDTFYMEGEGFLVIWPDCTGLFRASVGDDFSDSFFVGDKKKKKLRETEIQWSGWCD